MENDQDTKKGAGFTSFALKRMVTAILIFCAVLWALSLGLDLFKHPEALTSKLQLSQKTAPPQSMQKENSNGQNQEPPATESETTPPPAIDTETSAHTTSSPPAEPVHEEAPPAPVVLPETRVVESHGTPPMASSQPGESKATVQSDTHAVAEPPIKQPHVPSREVQPAARPVGVSFVEAVMQPMDYELNKRFWGWRPNDILNFTDNTNQFQLGVLEVTRRTAVQLAERISRTGSTDSFNRHLENTMNWLMIKADSYWFPTPESKYKESLKELQAYHDNLMVGKASFYTRADNLIPLLGAFEDLLGSCDENLVKEKEEGGSQVSHFKADDYFYYAKGIASALATILEAAHHDFSPVLESRNGAGLLHHAILSCRRAASLEPWFITDGELDGILANHRANMAAPISHARYYLGQLIKTLST